MLVGSLGIKIDQLAGHHQVTGDDITIGARESGQSTQSIAVELICADASGNRRLVAVGRDVLVRRRVVLVTTVIARRAPASAVLEATAAIVLTLITPAIPTAIITRTKVPTIIITTLKTATIPFTAIITTETAALTTVLKATAAIVPTLITPAIPTAIITRTKVPTIIITTLKTATIPITAIIAETTTTVSAIITTETAALTTRGAFSVTVTPLGLPLLVSTTAEFAASSSLFCHGVFPLFLRQRRALVHGAHRTRSTTQ
ncbi:MAG: hypothetical protein KHZ32_08415 [Actinomyces sp.]|nr:hypothetical protein [Actinomyces sp.]